MMTETLPERIRKAQHRWRYRGQLRPDFAIEPEPGQESVWDYPRPPSLVDDDREVTVKFGQRIIARSRHSIRVLETASPPTFYVSPDDVGSACLRMNNASTHCEWKGTARYFDYADGEVLIPNVAWCYAEPSAGFEAITGYYSFYPSRLECYLDGSRVQGQAGEFYGGWISPEIVGPFKGDSGSNDW